MSDLLPPLPSILSCLPDCMMPDGADPCVGYKRARDVIEIYREEIAALRRERDITIAKVRQEMVEQCSEIILAMSASHDALGHVSESEALDAADTAIRALTPATKEPPP